jgi:hypothetical protein
LDFRSTAKRFVVLGKPERVRDKRVLDALADPYTAEWHNLVRDGTVMKEMMIDFRQDEAP